ncbi:hypothetical protein [Gordonia neofelifaecis]|uniref:hypothetical protein n=1 Tax=Gordonia neofelifaecis TaxID=945692 RepID=UPI0002E9BBD8|nr:hypothetical protein [Gordonia neofelifaecis]
MATTSSLIQISRPDAEDPPSDEIRCATCERSFASPRISKYFDLTFALSNGWIHESGRWLCPCCAAIESN